MLHVLVDDVKLVLLADDTPDDCDVFDDYVEGHRQKGPENAQEETEKSEAINGERLDYSEDVHVNVNGSYEGADEIY